MVSLSVHHLVAAGSAGGGIIAAWLMGYAWRHRDVEAAVPFVALGAVVSVWSFCYAGALIAPTETIAGVLLTAAAVAGGQVAPLWVIFAIIYTRAERYQRLEVYALLWVVPAAYVFAIVTAPAHGLADAGATFQTIAGITAPVATTDVVGVSYAAFSYLLLLAGYLLLVRFLVEARNIYRKQTAAIVVGSVIPLVANALYELGFGPHPGLDPTPMAFVITGGIIGWALFEYDLLAVAPLASDMVIEELPDPVLILDASDTVVDHNAAAQAAFDVKRLTGTAIEGVAPALADGPEDDRLLSATASDDTDRDARYTPEATDITDQHGRHRGRLIVLRDVTAQRRRLDRIEALQAATEGLIDARIDDEIADVAVSFVDRILDQEVAIVFLADGDEQRLRPAAVSSQIRAEADGQLPAITPENAALWRHYKSTETDDVRSVMWDWEPLTATEVEELLVLSLGERGLFCIGSPAAEYTAGDRQFARILADAMETALDRVDREAQLRESRRLVRQHTEQLEFLNGVLRHNIRNGMQVIDSNADLLETHVDSTPASRQHLERIHDRTAELTGLTARIRSITDTVTTDPDERLWPVALRPALREQTTVLEAESDVAVDVDCEDDPIVLANGLLEDVFEIVLHNAVEHNDTDQPEIEIEVVPLGEWVQVRIADNGPGISDHFKESLFERDVSVSETAHGFGLYFVSLIVDLFEGDVWFEDNEPRGTIAVLEFQRAPTDDRT